MSLRLSRRDLLKIGGLGLATSLLGQKADAAALFGRMFAVPPRDTTYFTPNDKFYVVNYSDSPFSLSRDVRIDQWRLSITGAVKLPMALSYGDILQRPAIDRGPLEDVAVAEGHGQFDGARDGEPPLIDPDVAGKAEWRVRVVDHVEFVVGREVGRVAGRHGEHPAEERRRVCLLAEQACGQAESADLEQVSSRQP